VVQESETEYRTTTRWYAATTVGPSSSSKLNVILHLQQWNGAWNLTEELARLSNVTVAEVKAGAPGLDDEVLGTALAVTVVKEKFAAQEDMWRSIVSKATTFLDKQADTQAVQAALAGLVKLIRR